MFKSIVEEVVLRWHDEKRKREPLPQGPVGFFVYYGKHGIPYATNGKNIACWIPPSTLPKTFGETSLPGYWADVNANNKVTMEGEVIPATLEERLQRAFIRF